MKRWDGAAWQDVAIAAWDGARWTQLYPARKKWDGNAWRLSSPGWLGIAEFAPPFLDTYYTPPDPGQESDLVVDIPTSIDSTGTSDVTAALNGWIATVPDGTLGHETTLRFAPSANYRVEGTVLFDKRSHLIVDANDSRLFATTVGPTGSNLQLRRHIWCRGGTGLTFENLTVQGVNTEHHYRSKYAGQHAFTFAGTQGAAVNNVTVREVYGDFVNIGADTHRTWKWCSDISVQGNDFRYCGRQGVSLTSGQRITIQDNSISDAGLSVFDIEPDGGTGHDNTGFPTHGGATDVFFLNNTVGPTGTIFFACTGDTRAIIENVQIHGNNLATPLVAWVVGGASLHRTGISINDNNATVSHGGPRGGVEFVYVDNSEVLRNTSPVSNSDPVKVWGSDTVAVQGNHFVNATSPVLVDPQRFRQNWTGTASANITHCGNHYGPGGATTDGVCP